MEKTLVIIKPDGVRSDLIGEVIRRFERDGLHVVALKMARLTKDEAEGFYIVHRERPFYGSLTDFMSEAPVVALVLEGERAIERVRTIMGATNPDEAAPGTIRADFASSIERNIVHGSDSPGSASFEIPYFFSSLEILKKG